MRKRNPKVVKLPCTFHAEKDHVVAVIPTGDNNTIGIRFESVEHLLTFVSMAMEQAAVVWPNDPWVKKYQSD